MAINARHDGFQHVGPMRTAAIGHRALDGVPAGNRIVAVHHFAVYAETLATINDVLFAVLTASVGRNAPTVVGHDHQHRQFTVGPCGPNHARSKIAFRRARFAADDYRDAFAAHALLHKRRT